MLYTFYVIAVSVCVYIYIYKDIDICVRVVKKASKHCSHFNSKRSLKKTKICFSNEVKMYRKGSLQKSKPQIIFI